MTTSRELSIPRWFLPSELADDGRRRTVRDWLVDLGLFLAAVFIGLWQLSEPEAEADLAQSGLAFYDLLLGFAACVALWWRRRIPLILLWLMIPAQLAWSASGAVVVVVMTAALHRPWRPVVLAVAAHLVIMVPLLLYFELGEPPQLMVVAAVLFYLVPMLT
ncbi:MAG: sensor histidine kinase, partial [Stackebrandtia sp.]